MTLTIYAITPAWGLPCVSPFVTKVVFGLRMARVPFSLERQNPTTLAVDSPNGKVPYAAWPDGTRLADSSALLQHLVPEPPRSEEVQAIGLLAHRLIDEHLYWHAVVEPRWLADDAWLRYRTVLFGSDALSPTVLSFADAMRTHVLTQWRGCGLGMLPAAQRQARAREDVRALAALLGTRGPGLGGDRPCHGDLALAAMTAHMLETPFESAASAEARNHSVLSHHLDWVRQAAG